MGTALVRSMKGLAVGAMASPSEPSMVENPAPSEAEFRAWMAQYGPGLRRYFQRRADPAEADDLVQEVFLAMHRRVDQSPIGNVQGYLFRVAAGVLSKRPARARADLAPETYSLADELSPERRLLGREALERLVTALQALPPRARQAFTLHRFEEMTYAAIAVRMGVSVSAIEQLISRASERLTAAMEERP